MFDKNLCWRCRQERRARELRENPHTSYEDVERRFNDHWENGYTFCGPNYTLIVNDSLKTNEWERKEPADWCPFILEHTLMKGKKCAK
jgi:hypothetical protein